MERFEKRESQGRNIERDKQSFVEAISTGSIAEIPTDFDEVASQKFSENLARTNIFILGEMHGVKENAEIIYTLFRQFGFRQLALEWEPELREVAENYLETGELDFDAIKDSPDGRVTAGHFALLKRLKDEGRLDRLVCFDSGALGASWNHRDEAMAKNIIANLSDVPTLVVAGNHHAQIEPFSFKDETDVQHPMGEQVKKQIPNVSSGKIEYASGQFHNYGTQEFMKLSDSDLPPGARFYQDENGIYTFELPVAHVAVVPNPHERI